MKKASGRKPTDFEVLLTFSDKELAQHLSIIQWQIQCAIEQKNEKALVELQRREWEVILARMTKLDTEP